MDQNTMFVVDDDPIVLDIIQAMLKDTKLNVVTFDNPEEALGKITDARPQLVILDYNMPGISGQSLMIKVSEALGFGDTMFVLLSGEEFDDTKKMMLATCGLTHILHKPIQKHELFSLVESVYSKDVLSK